MNSQNNMIYGCLGLAGLMAAGFIGFVVLFIICCGGLAGVSNPATPTVYGESGDFNTELDARKFAERALREHLKYPNNATFHWGPAVTKLDSGLWQVFGKVDVMNGFGAKPTESYVVSLSLKDKTWTPVGVRLGDKILFMAKDELPVEGEP